MLCLFYHAAPHGIIEFSNRAISNQKYCIFLKNFKYFVQKADQWKVTKLMQLSQNTLIWCKTQKHTDSILNVIWDGTYPLHMRAIIFSSEH